MIKTFSSSLSSSFFFLEFFLFFFCFGFGIILDNTFAKKETTIRNTHFCQNGKKREKSEVKRERGSKEICVFSPPSPSPPARRVLVLLVGV